MAAITEENKDMFSQSYVPSKTILIETTTKKMLYEDLVRRQEQNIEFQHNFDIRIPASQLLAKDVYGFDVLKLDLSTHPKFHDKYIVYLGFKFVSTEYGIETLNGILENAKNNLSFGDHHLVFYGDFKQTQNLMIGGVILPVKLLTLNGGTYINILNIDGLVSVIDKVDVNISVSEVVFSEELEEKMSRKWARLEQYYERPDGTYNILNCCSGMGNNAFSVNQTKESTSESAAST